MSEFAWPARDDRTQLDRVSVHATNDFCSKSAAAKGAAYMREAIRARGNCNIILATGNSQLKMLEYLVKEEDVDWSKVTCFHLDEYIGVTESHKASFVGYLKERVVAKLPVPPAAFHFIDGVADNPRVHCIEMGELLDKYPIDVAFIGIGENAHVAFNDPPADFTTSAGFLVVALDEACRRQQVSEGWFPSMAAVPKQAMSMTIPRILASKAIIMTVPEERKAQAVFDTLTGEVRNDVPASIFRTHKQCFVFLDAASASLSKSILSGGENCQIHCDL